jgi:hypothetical protein
MKEAENFLQAAKTNLYGWQGADQHAENIQSAMSKMPQWRFLVLFIVKKRFLVSSFVATVTVQIAAWLHLLGTKQGFGRQNSMMLLHGKGSTNHKNTETD